MCGNEKNEKNIVKYKTFLNGGLFSGRYCELYPNEVKPCKVLAPKVECQAFETGELNECQNQGNLLKGIDNKTVRT